MVIGPTTHLEFVNADVIAAQRWPEDPAGQSYAAAYLITLQVVMVPEDLSAARVASRVEDGGHAVPEAKIRSRFGRLWPLVATAIRRVDRAAVYDDCRATRPFRVVAQFEHGALVDAADWPAWAPKALQDLH